LHNPQFMAKTNSATDTPLREQLERLAAFEPQGVPVVSLYLNLTPDQHGRDSYAQFCRKAFADRLKSFKEGSAEHASLERDVERINSYLENELSRSSNGLALFASSGSGEFFEAMQLDAPLREHWLFISEVPHLYPLAVLIDQYPRYAVVQLDTNRARIFVFGLGSVEKQTQVTGVKTRRTSMGGWSQARYQRHAENFHQHHVKDVVQELDRIVRADNIQHIIVVGDEVVVPLLRDALPAHLSEKIVDVMKLDRQAGDDEIAAATLDVVRQKDADSDGERVAEVIGAWRSGGLGVAGLEPTLRALQMRQVEELLMSAGPEMLRASTQRTQDANRPPVTAATSAPNQPDEKQLRLSDELVALATENSARVRIIEDPALLQEYDGVAAALRFRI
jgi:peptide subunit release factor 1 (eRF1)